MSLPPAIYRDIGDEVEASDRLIYRAFMRHLLGRRTSVERAVVATAKDTGVTYRRVLDIVRKHNPELPT